MKKTKMLLSCAIMLMFSVSVFAGQAQEKRPDCMIPPQDKQCCEENEMFFIFDVGMPKDNCPMFNKMKQDCMKDFDKKDDKHFKRNCCEKMIEKLNLTDKQKEDLKTLRTASMEETKKLMKEFREKTKELNDEFLNEKYNTKKIKTLNKELNEISSKVINNSIEKKKELRKIFTFEQYNKMFKPKTKYDILAERLNLSNEQKEKVTAIMENRANKTKELLDKRNEKKKLLNEEFEKEDCNKDIVAQLSKEMLDLSNEVFQLRINTRMELKSVLSFEQYAKLNNFHKKDKAPVPAPEKEMK